MHNRRVPKSKNQIIVTAPPQARPADDTNDPWNRRVELRVHRRMEAEFDDSDGATIRRFAGQVTGLAALRVTGLTWANMLRAFQVGNALTSDGDPSSWMRPFPVASAHES